jgi:hypothetical protein
MDPILRSYAHTAWTPLDPLQGLDPAERRAILLMPSTFRERLRLAPWTGPLQRRQAMTEILAERRLMLDLTTREVERQSPVVAAPVVAGQGGAPVGAYYQYRLGLHRQALETVHATRRDQDAFDLENSPQAAREALRRAARRRQLAEIIQERARLDLQELRILDGREDAEPPASRVGVRKSKRRSRDREEMVAACVGT